MIESMLKNRTCEATAAEAMQSCEVAVLIVDPESRLILDCNAATRRIFGYDKDELVGRSTLMLHVDEKMFRHFGQSKLLNEAFQRDGSFTSRYKMRRKNGEIFASEHIVSALYDDKHQPFRVVSAVRDISAEVKQVEAFAVSRAQLAFLLDKSPGVLYSCHIAGENRFVPTFCSPNIERLMGYTSDNFTDNKKLWEEGLHPEDIESVFAGYATLFETGHLLHRYRWRHKDGHYLWIRDEITLIRGDAGEPQQIIGVWVDISEQRSAEIKLAEHQADLEKTIDERTEQLQQAQDDLVHQERLAILGRLSASVSHELRNPLGTINNSLGALSEAVRLNRFDHLEKTIELAERNVARCDRILDELLAFAQKASPEYAIFNYGGWLNQILQGYSLPEGVTLALDLDDVGDVELDPDMLRRVLTSILDNAIQSFEFVEREDRQVAVTVRVDKGQLQTVVKDNGPGMSEESLLNIFEPLYSTKMFGVGLGMPIVKSLVEGQGGEIVVSSVQQEGTTVTMILPLARA